MQHNLTVVALNDVDLQQLRRCADSAIVGISADGARQTVAIGQGITAGSPFRIASLSKSLTATGVVRAAQQAGIQLDTPLLDLLPQLEDDWAADPRLTITDVLSQTSGLSATVTADDVARLGDGDQALLEAARLVVSAGNARPRGSSWEYYNGNYFIAGAVLAALAETTYERAIDSLVLRPWGLTATSFIAPTDLVRGVERDALVPLTAYPRARRPSGGFCSTMTDLLAFGEQLLHQPDLLQTIQTTRTRPDAPTQYGLGFALGPSGQLYLNGRLPGYRAALMIIPTQNIIGVVLAANSDALPAAAGILSNLQSNFTDDDLAEAIDTFAA